MSAAGREMGLSPAVVSKRMSQLEDRLGTRLFQRTTRHLTLTETGAGYLKRVVDILSLCEEAEDFICRRNTKPRGLLKVTMPTAFSRLHIAPHLGEFLSRFPEIELDVHVTDEFVDIIREGFDLAVRIGDLPDSSLVARRIAPDTRIICASPSYLEKHGEPASLADLDAHKCLMVDTTEGWRLVGPEGDIQVRPRSCARSNSAEFIRELVLAGAGIGMLSTWDVGPALHDGRLRNVLPMYRGTANGAVYAVYPSREFMPAKLDVLIDFLAGLYAPVPPWEKGLKKDEASGPRLPRPVTRRLAKGTGAAAVPR